MPHEHVTYCAGPGTRQLRNKPMKQYIKPKAISALRPRLSGDDLAAKRLPHRLV